MVQSERTLGFSVQTLKSVDYRHTKHVMDFLKSVDYRHTKHVMDFLKSVD